MRSRSLLFVLALALPAMAGCLDGDDDSASDDSTLAPGLTSVFERAELDFDVTGDFSRTLADGVFDILPAESVFVDVDLDPAELGGAVLDIDGVQIHLGLWLPDVPEGTQVPVIADVGPYYDDGDVSATEPANRLGRFLIENFVPHGYAVAQVSVTGTGNSDHCMDMMGDAEQAGVRAAVEWLGTQDWSSGNVGLIGRSYDGSTPWQAAAMGSEYLKTIVPISGLVGIPELMFNNGAAEARTLTFHNVVYGTFGVDSASVNPFAAFGGDPTGTVVVNDPDAGDLHNLCPDYLAATAHQTGEVLAQGYTGMTPYFAERTFFDRALENYDGSVYLIHGLQDWNVDPHAAMPFFPQMVEAWETKGLFGQWDHAYPDRPADHSDLTGGRGLEAGTATVRYDWAQDLLEWFDHYLMETGPEPLLHVEVQDHLGHWRVEETWPPMDADHTILNFTEADGPATLTINGAQGNGVYDFPPLSETDDLILTGIPVVKATLVTSGTANGLLYAEIRDAVNGTRLGHGIMDIRYSEGQPGAQDSAAAVVDVTLRMEAMEAYLPSGHGITVTIAGTGEGYLLNSNVQPYTWAAETASLHFDVRPAADAMFFAPVAWDTADRE